MTKYVRFFEWPLLIDIFVVLNRYMPLLLWRVESSGASQFDDSSVTDQSSCGDSPVVTKSPTTEKSSITLIALVVRVLASRQDGSSGASAAIMRAFETMLTHQRHSSARQHQHQAADESAEAELPPLLPPGCQPLVNTDTGAFLLHSLHCNVHCLLIM